MKNLVGQLRTGGLSRRDFIKILTGAGISYGAASLLATACSGPTATPTAEATAVPAATATPEPTQAPTAAPTAEPQTLRIAIGANPTNLNPADFVSQVDYLIMANMYEGLLEITPDGEYAPKLATDWTLSDDNLTWTFQLREGVKFHDGEEFNAEAAKAFYDYIGDPANEMGHLNYIEDDIDDIRATGDYTLEIVTKEPFFGLLNTVAYWLPIASPAALQRLGPDLKTQPVGTGPFVFEEWSPGSLVMLKNDEYWGSEPTLDRIEWRFLAEGNARVSALEAGDVDVIQDVSPTDIGRLREREGIDVRLAPSVRILTIHFNHMQEYFGDPRVRQAFNYAIDRQAIYDNILQGVGQIAQTYVTHATWGYRDPQVTYPYDPEKARQLLEEADFPFDETLKLYTPDGRSFGDRRTAEAIQGMLGEVGINVDVQVFEWANFVDAIWRTPIDDPLITERAMHVQNFGDFNAAFAAAAVELCEGGDNFLPEGTNYVFYCDEELDELIKTTKSTLNLDDRREMIGELIDYYSENAVRMPIADQQSVFAMRDNVEGLEVNPQQNLHLWNVRLG
jgi:peptide/nickel transport system substrate-binding protein